MHTLVLLRHGQSTWNMKNIFTGWTDVDLTEQGITEAKQAGTLLKKRDIHIDMCHTSLLKRAIRTLWIVLDTMDRMWVPVERSWRLNERHYGALQGLNKGETADKYGKEQVFTWRRSFDIPPPALTQEDSRWPGHDPRYALLPREEIPLHESLEMTINRTLPYWHSAIAPALRSGKTVLVCAHGNSLRGLVKYLDGISDTDIPGLNIPTGIPLVYSLDEELRPLHSEYLGDPDKKKQAAAEVAAQASKPSD